MTMPAFPSPAKLLATPAQALAGIEVSLPVALPRLSQSLISIATILPTLPVPGALGGTVTSIPSLPLAPSYRLAQNGGFGRPGAPRQLPQRVRSGLS